MRNFLARLLILTLVSLNTYAGPFVDRNRPDIRPGQRGSIAQEVMGSTQNQYSPLNPGSNQALFLRNNFLLQQYGNNTNANGYMTFNPQSSLSGNGSIASIDVMAKHLLESNGGNALTNRVAPDPFASKVAKSQTQGMVFINSASTKPSVRSDSMSLDVGSYIPLILDTANKNTIAINYPGQTFGFAPSATTTVNPDAK